MKKLLAVLAALMLALTPVLSLAATAPAFTFSTPVVNLAALIKDLTGMEEIPGINAVQDILKIASFSGYALDGQFGLQLKLEGENVADVNFKGEVTGQDLVLYAGSNLLGDKVVKVSLMDVIKMTGLEEQLALIMAQAQTVTTSGPQIDMEALMKLVIIDQAAPTEGEYDCDASAMKLTVTLPAANFPELVKTLGLEGVEVSALPADLKAVVLMDAQGGLTYLEVGLEPVKLTAARKTTDVLTYTTKLDLGVLAMDGSLVLDAAGFVSFEMKTEGFSLTASRDAADPKHYTANISAGSTDSGVSMDMSFVLVDNGCDMDIAGYAVSGNQRQELVRETVTVRAGETGITEDITLTSPVIPAGLNIYAEIGQEGVLYCLSDATKTTQYLAYAATADTCEVEPLNTANAVDILKLSAEEMEAFTSEATATATLALLGALSHLPASVMELMMQ